MRSRGGGGTASIFDEELRRCADAAAVLKVASSTRLPLGPEDLLAFFDRLKALGKVPRVGADLHAFVAKVQAGVASSGTAAAGLAVSRFAELRCRQGALAAWPCLQPHLAQLEPAEVAEAIWAASAIPKPPLEVVGQLQAAAMLLAPRLGQLPETPTLIYRCLYGIARVSRGTRCEEFRKRAERFLAVAFDAPGPCPLAPSQLVRLCWALGRMGCRKAEIFRALERRLRNVVGELSDRELEALYRVLTDLGRTDQWRLIFDTERAMEARQGQRPGDPNKAPRRRPFSRKWTRVSPLTHSAVGPARRRPAHRAVSTTSAPWE